MKIRNVSFGILLYFRQTYVLNLKALLVYYWISIGSSQLQNWNHLINILSLINPLFLDVTLYMIKRYTFVFRMWTSSIERKHEFKRKMILFILLLSLLYHVCLISIKSKMARKGLFRIDFFIFLTTRSTSVLQNSYWV